jgi:hypothetical protein
LLQSTGAVPNNLLQSSSQLLGPLDLLTSDERPSATGRDHDVWSPEEIKRLLGATRTLAKKPYSKYD